MQVLGVRQVRGVSDPRDDGVALLLALVVQRQHQLPVPQRQHERIPLLMVLVGQPRLLHHLNQPLECDRHVLTLLLFHRGALIAPVCPLDAALANVRPVADAGSVNARSHPGSGTRRPCPLN